MNIFFINFENIFERCMKQKLVNTIALLPESIQHLILVYLHGILEAIFSDIDLLNYIEKPAERKDAL